MQALADAVKGRSPLVPSQPDLQRPSDRGLDRSSQHSLARIGYAIGPFHHACDTADCSACID